MTGATARWLIGFAGSLTVILVVPRLIRFAVRNYAFRLVAEIIAIISFGLLAEKVVDWSAESKTIPAETD